MYYLADYLSKTFFQIISSWVYSDIFQIRDFSYKPFVVLMSIDEGAERMNSQKLKSRLWSERMTLYRFLKPIAFEYENVKIVTFMYINDKNSFYAKSTIG